MITPRRQTAHVGPAAVRAALYAWLEEIRFRTGVALLAGLVMIVGGVIALLAVTGGGRTPAPHPLAQRAPVTVAPSPAADPRPSHPAPKRHHARVTVTHPARPAASVPADPPAPTRPAPAAPPAPASPPGAPGWPHHGGFGGGWPWGWPGTRHGTNPGHWPGPGRGPQGWHHFH